MHYAGFKLIRQQLVFKEKKPYDVLQFYVYYLTDEDWEYLKSDYENHNQYEGDEEGLKKHNEMMEEMVKSYKSECWIDISKFFGKF